MTPEYFVPPGDIDLDLLGGSQLPPHVVAARY